MSRTINSTTNFPSANIDFVKGKIQNLRNASGKEMKKVVESRVTTRPILSERQKIFLTRRKNTGQNVTAGKL